jgi:cell shape-determining protein MreC
MVQSFEDVTNLRRAVRDTRRQVNRLRARVAELEEEVQENRRLNRRLAELTDVVQELLIPIEQRDEKRLKELLDKYSETL